MVLVGWIRPSFSGFVSSEGIVSRLKAFGGLGALLLGLLFSLSFCPISAGLFFGSLIPLTMQQGAPVSLPLAYGIGTGLPVLSTTLMTIRSCTGIGRCGTVA